MAPLLPQKKTNQIMADHENSGSDSSTRSTPTICTVDPYEYLRITKHPDGTITRLEFPSTPSSSDPTITPSSSITKDVPLNPKNNTWIRLYLPKASLATPNPSKLPIIVYFHGGGFVIFHADTTLNHDLCVGLAAETNALVLSVEYRLGPEHRLPAAYDDAMEALEWIKGKGVEEEEWLIRYGDRSRCFLMGTSSGGNIVYHVGLRASCLVDELEPLRVRGLILHQPFFGGVQRTESELRLMNDPILPLSGSDLMWELALPVGADRDHEYSNLNVSGGSGLERVKELGWRVLVTGCCGDPLVHRAYDCVRILEGKGISVMTHISGDGFHCVELVDPAKAKELFGVLISFFESCLQ